ncbi:MAG: winged helix-turn-helix domain-containing protein [Methanomicrobium sp.]|nr:winged helix-turn-helix domain-containing protein [Methanomicrobium sp.]
MTDSVVLLEPGDDRAKKIGKAMASQTANDILSNLKKGDQTLSEIAENLNQPLTTIKYHIENLLDAGLIEVKKIKYSEKGREVKVYGVCEQIVIVSAGNNDIRQVLMKYASVFSFFILSVIALGIITSTIFSGIGGLGNTQTQSAGISPSGDFVSADYISESELYSEAVYDNTTDDSSVKGLTLRTLQPSEDALADDENHTSANAQIYDPEPQSKPLLTKDLSGNFGSGIRYDTALDEKKPEYVMHIAVLSFFAGGCVIIVLLMVYEALIWRKEKKYWKIIKEKENTENDNEKD